jgi:predicted nucleic acid-binding protein
VIVIDASVAVELLLASEMGRRAAARTRAPTIALHAPELLDIEVVSVLRKSVLRGRLDEERATVAVAGLLAWDVERHSHGPLVQRAWSLRSGITAYDATYVALAEALGATLLTCDARLARTAERFARVEVVGR